jgi:hypothetical protein
MRATVPFTLAVLLLLSACGGREPEAEPAAQWKTATVLEAATKLGGCAVGDLFPTVPGDDIAAVGYDGSVYAIVEMHVDGDRVWDSGVVAKMGGEMIQCAIGDADPTRPGNEIVAVGMKAGVEGSGGAGAAWLVYPPTEDRGSLKGWGVELIREDTALVHGTCIAEMDPTHEGNEVVLVGFSNNAHVLGRTAAGWKTLATVPLGSPGKHAVAWLGGAAVPCAGGAVMHVRRTEHGTWTAEVVGRAAAGYARIAADGDRLLVARDDGALALRDAKGAWTEIHREGQKLRGAAFADLDPRAPGLEAATAGYERKVTVLRWGEEAWKAETVFEDTGRMHHLAAGHVIDRGDGSRAADLVTCGYSKRVTIIWRE